MAGKKVNLDKVGTFFGWFAFASTIVVAIYFVFGTTLNTLDRLDHSTKELE